MTAGCECPACHLGRLAPMTDCRWLRCPWCITSFDTHGHAYDLNWRPVPL